MLSAVSPEKMSLVLQNIKKVLKVSGHSISNSEYIPKLFFYHVLCECDFSFPFLSSQLVMCCFVTMLLVTLPRFVTLCCPGLLLNVW